MDTATAAIMLSGEPLEGAGGTAGLAASSTSESPTVNDEKWVTANLHMHLPFCTEPMHCDISSGDDEEIPALASEIANPCSRNGNRALHASCQHCKHTFIFEDAFTQLVAEMSTANDSVMPPVRVSTVALVLMETRGLRGFPAENKAANAPA